MAGSHDDHPEACALPFRRSHVPRLTPGQFQRNLWLLARDVSIGRYDEAVPPKAEPAPLVSDPGDESGWDPASAGSA